MWKYKKLLQFIISVLVLTFFCYFIKSPHVDEIWTYGFSYNLTKGAIPYRDFNMVILPFYSLLVAIPLKLICNNLFIFHLVNSVLISLILVFCNKNIISHFIVIGFIILSPVCYGYNCFVSILLILILYLEKKDIKYKNEVIGVILGIILMTKQSIGVVLFFPYIINSKDKIKSILYFLITPTLILIYLVLNNALYNCIDYCILGLGNFTENFSIVPIYYLLEIIVIIYIVANYQKNKDINYIYIILFQIINYPILDMYHFIMGVIPFIYYSCYNKNNRQMIAIFITLLVLIITTTMLNSDFYLSNLSPFKYRNMDRNRDDEIISTINYIESNLEDKHYFIFSNNAYYVKMYQNEKIDKFDLINKGNMGKDERKYIREINEICEKKECVFILDYDLFDKSQFNPIIREYVINNYKYCGNINSTNSIYCSTKK